MQTAAAAATRNTVICLGPVGSGKTLLLKKLQSMDAVDSTSNTVPTIGSNIIEIQCGGGGGGAPAGEDATNKRPKQPRIVRVRELGGVMAPLWSKYLDNIKKVLYMVDTSNLCQISATGVLLYTLLSHPHLQKAKFLLVLTKMDVSYRQMRNEALLMLQITRLQKEIAQKVQIVEASAISGEGREEILAWLAAK